MDGHGGGRIVSLGLAVANFICKMDKQGPPIIENYIQYPVINYKGKEW